MELVALALTVALAGAPTSAPPMGIGLDDARPRNAGTYSCLAFTHAMRDDAPVTVDRLRIRIGVAQWFAGYLSALNDRAPAKKREKSDDLATGSLGWLMGYCVTHPTGTVFDAAATWSRKDR